MTKDPEVDGSKLSGVKCFDFLEKNLCSNTTKYGHLNGLYLDKKYRK